MATVRVNDLDVYFTERGEGPPVVLLHGGLATAEMSWQDELIAGIAATHRVLMPDSRGHGRTANPADSLSYAQTADDVAAFCTALGLSSPVIIGYSDGGQTAIEIGLRHPGLARALVLGGVVITRSPAYMAMLARMGLTQPGAVDLVVMREEFGDHFELMVTKPHQDWERLLRQISRLWLTVPTYDDAQLAAIREPCLVICGDRDRGSLDDAVRLMRALPTAELAVVPCSEHGAMSKPMFWTNVADFLSRHEADRVDP